MAFPKLFKTLTGGTVITDLVNPYTLDVEQRVFVDFQTSLLYQKILKRCYAKSKGLSDEQALNLWDSVELSNAKHGTITLISQAMTTKQELILVNDSGIVRIADNKEAQVTLCSVAE